MKAISMSYLEWLERCWDRVMVTMSSEYSICLYREKVDLRKGKKILVREHNRFELTQIRLDSGKFFKPIMDDSRRFGKICWSDLVMLTEASVCGNIRTKYVG